MSQRTRRSTTQWQALVHQQADSGLSALRFCKEHQIGYASFCQWRKRLASGPVTADPVIDISQLFREQANQGWKIELDLGNGIKLNLKPA